MTNYDAANLLILLDNSRNMRRTLELISLFDSDAFAGQRVRAFAPGTDGPAISPKSSTRFFQAYALSDKAASVRFLAIDRDQHNHRVAQIRQHSRRLRTGFRNRHTSEGYATERR